MIIGVNRGISSIVFLTQGWSLLGKYIFVRTPARLICKSRGSPFPFLLGSSQMCSGSSMLAKSASWAANDKQEWEICGIIDKENVGGVPHYWVQWSPTLVPKSEIGKARALVARFEAGLRAQHKQKGGKGRGRLLPSRADKQAAAGVRATGQKQEKKRRGRPRK
jgi:hypothetical protein